MQLLSCSYATKKGNIKRGEELQRKENPLCNQKKKKNTKDPENFFFFLVVKTLTQEIHNHRNTFFWIFFPQTDRVTSIFMSPLKKTWMSQVKRLSHSGNRLQLGKSSGQPPAKALRFSRQACSKQKSLFSSARSGVTFNSAPPQH